jgi:hypothetical protein
MRLGMALRTADGERSGDFEGRCRGWQLGYYEYRPCDPPPNRVVRPVPATTGAGHQYTGMWIGYVTTQPVRAGSSPAPATTPPAPPSPRRCARPRDEPGAARRRSACFGKATLAKCSASRGEPSCVSRPSTIADHNALFLVRRSDGVVIVHPGNPCVSRRAVGVVGASTSDADGTAVARVVDVPHARLLASVSSLRPIPGQRPIRPPIRRRRTPPQSSPSRAPNETTAPSATSSPSLPRGEALMSSIRPASKRIKDPNPTSQPTQTTRLSPAETRVVGVESIGGGSCSGRCVLVRLVGSICLNRQGRVLSPPRCGVTHRRVCRI